MKRGTNPGDLFTHSKVTSHSAYNKKPLNVCTMRKFKRGRTGQINKNAIGHSRRLVHGKRQESQHFRKAGSKKKKNPSRLVPFRSKYFGRKALQLPKDSKHPNAQKIRSLNPSKRTPSGLHSEQSLEHSEYNFRTKRISHMSKPSNPRFAFAHSRSNQEKLNRSNSETFSNPNNTSMNIDAPQKSTSRNLSVTSAVLSKSLIRLGKHSVRSDSRFMIKHPRRTLECQESRADARPVSALYNTRMHKSTKYSPRIMTINSANFNDSRKVSHEEYAFPFKKVDERFNQSIPCTRKNPIFHTRNSLGSSPFFVDRQFLILEGLFEKKRLLFKSKFFGIIENLMRQAKLSSIRNSQLLATMGNSPQVNVSNISSSRGTNAVFFIENLTKKRTTNARVTRIPWAHHLSIYATR